MICGYKFTLTFPKVAGNALVILQKTLYQQTISRGSEIFKYAHLCRLCDSHKYPQLEKSWERKRAVQNSNRIISPAQPNITLVGIGLSGVGALPNIVAAIGFIFSLFLFWALCFSPRRRLARNLTFWSERIACAARN